ncbi:MAG: PSD1 domain-containing protein [Planctomycetes bacterium]|nr:PSD1 domain-containing protein [Planctomycetota bacterium]
MGPHSHAGERVDYARDIAPIFAKRCIRCHGPKRAEGGLRLDVRRRAHIGGDTGPALVPKQTKKSELLRRINAGDDKRMPPAGDPLTDKQKDLLRAWIEQGAAWPDELAGKEDHQSHWAFRPVKRPPVPKVKNRPHVRSPIDAFLLARLESKGSKLSPPASATTLLRRLHLDLIGLPPTPDEVDAFVKDYSAPSTQHSALEKVVARLLASPHYGERWGRHWLDLARFAESDGYENDNLRPHAWRYRDWVIDAVNRDLPFDRFTIEQLAGDLLPNATTEQKVATGLHRNTLWNSAASGDKEEFRTYAIRDRADTTAAAWMGLTLGCAKCHSHKYDPISQREYYQFYAFFNNTNHQDIALPDGGKAMTLIEKKRVTHIHKRGNFLHKGDEVVPGTPTFLPPLTMRGKMADRLDLARWLVNPKHPLTARVTVNRIWQQLFGVGLVATPENFGLSGQPPSHPELLDWLADEFVRLKWSQKALIRAIVLSEAYRQRSVVGQAFEPDAREKNVRLESLTYFSRQNRFRVEAEIVRDLALAASGLLDRKLGGPSIVPPFPEGLLAQRFQAEALRMPTKAHHRRGVYIHVQRTLTYPMLAAFDAADGNQPCLRRDRSTTPMQALTLLNDPVFTEAAKALGARLQKSAAERDERLRLGFLFCLGRAPKARELGVLSDLVAVQQKLGASEDAIWTGVARTLLNLDEFITRE